MDSPIIRRIANGDEGGKGQGNCVLIDTVGRVGRDAKAGLIDLIETEAEM